MAGNNGKPRLAVFAGSLRRESYNRRLALVAADMVEEAGAEAVRVDLADYPMPLYDADFEAESGLPAAVVAVKEVFSSCEGFIAASPEYNGSLSPLMKNAIDWMSRKGDDPAPMMPFRDKVAGLLSASPGGLGGLRGLIELRRVLGGLGVVVSPVQHALGGAGAAFGEDGELVDEATRKAVERVVAKTVELARRLA